MFVHTDQEFVMHGAFMPALASSDDTNCPLFGISFFQFRVCDLIRVGPCELIARTNNTYAFFGRELLENLFVGHPSDTSYDEVRIRTAYLLTYSILYTFAIKQYGDFCTTALNRFALLAFRIIDTIV